MAVPHRRSSPDHKALSCHIKPPASKLRLAQLLDREYMGVAGLFFHDRYVLKKLQGTVRSVRTSCLQMPFYAPCYFLCLCAKTERIH